MTKSGHSGRSRAPGDRARVALLAGSHAVDDIYQGAVSALLPFFIADRRYSYAAATGLTFAATALSSVIQPVFGALTDRPNPRWLVPAGLTVAGVGIGLSGLTASYLLTWLAIALSGIGVGGGVPPGGGPGGPGRLRRQPAADERVLPRRQRRFRGRPAVRDGSAGRHRPPWHGLPGRAGGGHRRRRVHGPAAWPPGRSRAARQASRQAGGKDDWRGFALLTSAVIVRSVFFGLSSLLALYVGTGLHGGRQAGEAALTTMLMAGAAGTVTGRRLADRFGRLAVIRTSFAVTALGLAAIALTGLPWVFGVIALTGFALNQSFSLTVTLGQDYLSTRIGTSSGVTLGLAISIGGLVTPFSAPSPTRPACTLPSPCWPPFRWPAWRWACGCTGHVPRPPASRRPPCPPCNSAPRL